MIMIHFIKRMFSLVIDFFSILSNLIIMLNVGLSDINKELIKFNKEREVKRLRAEKERLLKEIDDKHQDLD